MTYTVCVSYVAPDLVPPVMSVWAGVVVANTWVTMAFARVLVQLTCVACARGRYLWNFDETRRILLWNTTRSDFDIKRVFD